MSQITEAVLSTIAHHPALNQGEFYAGILLGKDGQPDQHIILIEGDEDGVTWKEAQEFAAKVGGELPTRREQALLYANLKEQFKPAWYWSGEQHAGYEDYAWAQHFDLGYQNDSLKDDRLRARVVRRLIIQ